MICELRTDPSIHMNRKLLPEITAAMREVLQNISTDRDRGDSVAEVGRLFCAALDAGAFGGFRYERFREWRDWAKKEARDKLYRRPFNHLVDFVLSWLEKYDPEFHRCTKGGNSWDWEAGRIDAEGYPKDVLYLIALIDAEVARAEAEGPPHPEESSPTTTARALPSWDRLSLIKGPGGDVATLDGKSYLLGGNADAQLLEILKGHKGAPIKAVTLSDQLGERVDRIYNRLPDEIKAIIDKPNKGGRGYRIM